MATAGDDFEKGVAAGLLFGIATCWRSYPVELVPLLILAVVPAGRVLVWMAPSLLVRLALAVLSAPARAGQARCGHPAPTATG
jgi:hypothetical protein